MSQDDPLLFQLWVTHPNGITMNSGAAVENVADLFPQIGDWFTPGEPFKVIRGEHSFMRENPAVKAVEIRTIRKSRYESQRAADINAAENHFPELLKKG